jgi:TetR/AcrR family transcriptional regulator, transcriptional repressor for nem operon
MGRTSDANERLMTAALDLMWEESYGAVTIDDICKRADVKKGSFYYFFESKAHLAVAALEKMWSDDWKPRLDACLSPSIDPLTRLTEYLQGVYTIQAEIHRKTGKVLGCPVCSVGSEISTQEVDVSAKIREIMSRKRRYYESAIRDAIAAGVMEPGDPVQKAQSLFCLIEGAVTQARIMNDPELLRALPANAFDLLRVKVSPAAAPGSTPAPNR